MEEASTENTIINKQKLNNNNKDKINNKISNNNIFDYKITKTLKYHKKCVNYLLLLKDNRLASVSDDNYLIIYNIYKNVIDLQIEIHSNPVKYITQFDDGIIATTSLDKSIKLFTINENNEIKTIQSLYGHSGPVFKIIKLTNNYLASCGEAQNIKLWNKENDIKSVLFQLLQFYCYYFELCLLIYCLSNIYKGYKISNLFNTS